MKKITVVLFAMLIASSLGACKGNDEKNNSNGKNVKNKITKEKDYTVIYLAKAEESTDDGLAAPLADCDKNLIKIKLDGKLSPQQTLEKLFSYKESSEDKNTFNIFASAKTLKIEDMIIKNNFAIVKLSGELSAKNMCSDRQTYNQIKKTLIQFDNIAGADIFMNGQELSQYFATTREQSEAVVK